MLRFAWCRCWTWWAFELGNDKSSLSNGSYHHRDISQICTMMYAKINEKYVVISTKILTGQPPQAYSFWKALPN